MVNMLIYHLLCSQCEGLLKIGPKIIEEAFKVYDLLIITFIVAFSNVSIY